MLYTETPDESGWYWVQTWSDDWMMAHLDTNRECVLSLMDPSLQGIAQWQEEPDGGWTPSDGDKEYWRGPAKWFGPLACPGGEWARTTVEFKAASHAEAKRQGKALVVMAVDATHCPGKHVLAGATTVLLMSYEDSHELPGTLFAQHFRAKVEHTTQEA